MRRYIRDPEAYIIGPDGARISTLADVHLVPAERYNAAQPHRALNWQAPEV